MKKISQLLVHTLKEIREREQKRETEKGNTDKIRQKQCYRLGGRLSRR